MINGTSSGTSLDEEGVTLSFSVAGELSTHTNLSGSENAQHVTSVRLYILNGTTDNGTSVTSEDISWSSYFGNNPPTVSSTMKYSIPFLEYGQTPVFKDYINSPLSATGENILVEIPVPGNIMPVTVPSKNSYVLPVSTPTVINANDYTLRVELVNGSGNVLRYT